MSTRILINGAFGRMGSLAVKTISNHKEFDLVAKLGRENSLADEIKKTKADVVLDLTNAESVFKNVKTILAAGARPVVGTSGLLKDDIEFLKEECKKLNRGALIIPNFSIGAMLMMKYAAEAAKYFSNVEIIEMHHAGKLDSPSGTALRTAEDIAAARTQKPDALQFRESVKGARGATYQDIPIHSIRLPGLVAHQQVLFGGVGETLSIRHDSIDRECFMPGVVLACKKVMDLDKLVYGLDELIK